MRDKEKAGSEGNSYRSSSARLRAGVGLILTLAWLVVIIEAQQMFVIKEKLAGGARNGQYSRVRRVCQPAMHQVDHFGVLLDMVPALHQHQTGRRQSWKLTARFVTVSLALP